MLCLVLLLCLVIVVVLGAGAVFGAGVAFGAGVVLGWCQTHCVFSGKFPGHTHENHALHTHSRLVLSFFFVL